MTSTRTVSYCIIALSICAVLCGCGKKPETPAEETDLAQQLNQKAVDLYYEGNTNEAIQTLEEALLNNSIESSSKQRLFGSLINLHLQSSQPETAETKTLAAFVESPEYLDLAAPSIMNYYQQTDNIESLLSWCARLIDMEIPEQLKGMAFLRLLQTYQANQQFENALALINDRSSTFSPDMRNRILKTFTYQIMKTAKYDDAEQILAAGGKLFPDDANLREIAQIARIDILFGSKQWDKGIEKVKTAATQLNDDITRGILIRASRAMSKDNLSEKSSSLCKHILLNNKDLGKTCTQAALTYISTAEGIPTECAARLAFLETAEISKKTFFSCYRNCFYDVLGSGDKKLLQQMKDISDRFGPGIEKEQDTAIMKLFSLELAFMMEDYVRGIELVKAGIPNKDEEWSSYAIEKMQAHQALKTNNPEKAIEHFRNFMTMVATNDESETDPTTGILHSKEMILGRNAKRIGDIYLSIDKKDNAAESYNEAEQYYINAKKNMDEKNVKTHKLITSETALVMQAKAKLSLN